MNELLVPHPYPRGMYELLYAALLSYLDVCSQHSVLIDKKCARAMCLLMFLLVLVRALTAYARHCMNELFVVLQEE